MDPNPFCIYLSNLLFSCYYLQPPSKWNLGKFLEEFVWIGGELLPGNLLEKSKFDLISWSYEDEYPFKILKYNGHTP